MCGILKQTLEYAVDAEYIEKNPYRVKVNKKKFANSSKKPSAKEVFQAGEKELFINEMERRLVNNLSNTASLAVLLDFELGTRKGAKSEDGDRWLPPMIEKINPAIPIESSSIPDEQREITIAKSNVAILNHTTFT